MEKTKLQMMNMPGAGAPGKLPGKNGGNTMKFRLAQNILIHL